MTEAVRAYISLGSNIGDRAKTLNDALRAIAAAGMRVTRVSSFYETEPADAPQQGWFLNAVAEMETSLPAPELLRELAAIEQAFGRQRVVYRGPRTLDLDILLYGASVLRTSELEVPHPRMAERRFVLVPLAELAPELQHPVLHKSVSELLSATNDANEVRRWEPETAV